MSTALLIIDPQNDFCSPNGSLYVAGAQDDCKRLSTFIENNCAKIDEVYVSLDTHYFSHIFFKNFWKNKNNEQPTPFTTISFNQIENQEWLPVDESLTDYVKAYTKKLALSNRYTLTIWPEHCIHGSWGHAVEQSVQKTLLDCFEKNKSNKLEYIIKGVNPKTEHYSTFQAEVVDPKDTTTQLNIQLLNKLDRYDTIYIAGQALSHCVLNTIIDMSEYISPEKFILLDDCCSCIAGYEKSTQEKLDFFTSYGMKKARYTTSLE
ncbi:MAG: hypothetical protein ACRC4W_05185 [Treponemataceae bacterium]